MSHVTMGYAQTDITPTEPMQLVGYDARPDNYSRGVLHRLLAQTLVWQSPEQTCCLVTIDSLGFTTALSHTLRQQLADALQTTPEHVMLCFSHTHAAPNAAVHPDYFTFVCAQLEQAVRQARAFMVPVQAAWGSARNTIGVNRRDPDLGFDDRLGILQITGSDPHDLGSIRECKSHDIALRKLSRPNIIQSNLCALCFFQFSVFCVLFRFASLDFVRTFHA